MSLDEVRDTLRQTERHIGEKHGRTKSAIVIGREERRDREVGQGNGGVRGRGWGGVKNVYGSRRIEQKQGGQQDNYDRSKKMIYTETETLCTCIQAERSTCAHHQCAGAVYLLSHDHSVDTCSLALACDPAHRATAASTCARRSRRSTSTSWSTSSSWSRSLVLTLPLVPQTSR
jgi:hypothetical protein